MSATPGFKAPLITDEDIRTAANYLGLKADAFSGPKGDDERAKALKTLETKDIAACPGSGKTTLLVAKLAILSMKWEYCGRGICVLSHTNVARNEIESRLGHTAAGRRLLGYPHFIGTIHSFINEFLAIPWLNSLNFSIKMIDTDIALNRRWNALAYGTRSGMEKAFLTRKVLQARGTSTFCMGE